MHSMDFYLIGGSLLLLFSVISSKASGKLGVPSLVLFVGLGVLAGSEGLGGYVFDHPLFVQTLGVVALIFILFAGGLDTDCKAIRRVLWSGLSLATVGIFTTTLLMGWFAKQVLGFTWLEGLLLGAIVSSTDAAAVFAVLRARSLNLVKDMKPLLELESGSNDPTAVFLTVAILGLMTQKQTSALEMIPSFILQMALGGVSGFLSGKGIHRLINSVHLEIEGLYPVLTIALVLFTYGFTEAIGGNGYLAVYLCGLILGSENFIHKKSLTLFHDGLAWLMQISMFLALGLQVYPSRLLPVAGTGLLLSALLIFVARPLSIYLSLFRSRYNFKEKALISWVGLRGAVPIILATYPLLAGIPKADTIFHLVFFIVLSSVLIQGMTTPAVAKWLKVDAPVREKFKYPLEYVPTSTTAMKSDLVEIMVPKNSIVIGKAIVDLKLPASALIVLIQRNADVLVPRGGTFLEEGDHLLVLSDRGTLAQVRKLIAVHSNA